MFFYGQHIGHYEKPGKKNLQKKIPDYESVFLSRKGRLIVVLCLVLAGVYYLQVESAYRPKTTVGKTNPALQERLREIDTAEAPVIKPAEGDLKDAENSNYSEKNKKSAEATKDAFNKLEND